MTRRLTPLFVIAALVITTAGCATRRYVRNRTEPLNEQVGELDKRSAENGRKIGELDDKTSREISRVGEKANAADARAGDASRQATEALTKGGQAIEKAEGARSLAENSMTRTGQLEGYLDTFDNYQMATSKTIYFGFDKAMLDDQAKQELDGLAQSLSSMKKFVVEVQGFTDTTGPANYNYALSERRAATVVRYLTEQHKIPVYRVHRIGLGKAMPAQAENRREARKLSRRVEVKAYTRPDLPQTAQRAAPSEPAQTQPSATQPPATTTPETQRPPEDQPRTEQPEANPRSPDR